MTIRSLPIALALVALLGASTPAQAKKKGGKGASRLLTHFDKNHDGVIAGPEVEAVRAAFASLVALDTNHDGELSESELAAAKIGKGKGGKKKKS